MKMVERTHRAGCPFWTVIAFVSKCPAHVCRKCGTKPRRQDVPRRTAIHHGAPRRAMFSHQMCGTNPVAKLAPSCSYQSRWIYSELSGLSESEFNQRNRNEYENAG